MADEKDDVDGIKFFAEHIAPIFKEHCFKCHGNGKSKGGLSLYTHDSILEGGESGAAVDLDDPSASLLLDALNYDGFEMPPAGKLPQESIDLVAKWIKMGAPVPERDDVIELSHSTDPQVNDETRNHWSFRPVKRPDVPSVKNAEWVKSPVDAFVLKHLEAEGITPSKPADRRQLMRRVHYDLLGLPPDPAEVEAFANDTDPQAYPKLVDRLLASPHYGEHWARYWLDLVRYGESNSFERDNPKPFVWKYRDYVIRSLNADKPYDQFVMEQLAGDELDNVTAESIIATGFYRLGQWDDEPADPKLARFDELDDIIATTSQGMLGLTMNCCRCHDHKLDPIPQADYYKFLSFFSNMKRYGIRGDNTVYDASVRSIATPEEMSAFAKERSEHEQKVKQLRGELDAVENDIRPHLIGGEKDDFNNDSVRLRIIRKYVGKHITKENLQTYAAKRKEWTDLRNNPPKSAAQALCIKEHGRDPGPTFVLLRGNPALEGDVVEPAFPSVLGFPEPSIEVPGHGESSGRRRALAEWVVSSENPLTARVMANRLWQWHFGRGIVRTPNNFGLQGDLPTHPELLDWLASEFVHRGWSMKQMHRLILLSNAYQMASAPREDALEKDPQNNLFWRFDMRRLRAEEVRDSLLAVNGTLRPDEMYGPQIYPEIPAEVLHSQSRPGANWHTSSKEAARRRSIYIHIKRSLTVPLLASFDVAESDFTCPVRFATTQPTQALGMMNSAFLNQQAQLFADLLKKQHPGQLRPQIEMALTRAFQRPPTSSEVERGEKLISDLQSEFEQTPAQALKNFCLLVLNTNEFLYLD